MTYLEDESTSYPNELTVPAIFSEKEGQLYKNFKNYPSYIRRTLAIAYVNTLANEFFIENLKTSNSPNPHSTGFDEETRSPYAVTAGKTLHIKPKPWVAEINYLHVESTPTLAPKSALPLLNILAVEIALLPSAEDDPKQESTEFILDQGSLVVFRQTFSNNSVSPQRKWTVDEPEIMMDLIGELYTAQFAQIN